ncbi:uncharacterized protein BYT42DRAFT_570561 [Radiomyces spectabilis]|uniref:uncharacterized protein n=1 Tax=Radiomyces spectabilis TaxID=64574 RepID=UPI002220CF56|nr:uncharacterized protein BYT42DRAFT_570561 [Radiomyces spectabilis]KAI8377511.1 hypothetical protein BYT42DRAFT_570561 [Radiomyces spectabilis]
MTANELYYTRLADELETLLDTFCSEQQQQFCKTQRIASPQQLQQIQQTIHQVRELMPGVGLIRTANGENLRRSLVQVAEQMLEKYQEACHKGRIQELPETQGWLSEWQDLSHQFDLKAKEQANLKQLIRNLKQLRQAWRKTRDIHLIVHSMLATFEFGPGTHVVMIDHHNYHQLGFKRRSVGRRHIVFENDRLSRQDQRQSIEHLCERFADIFAQNAQQNLLQIDAQLCLGQLTNLSKRLRQLHNQVLLVDFEMNGHETEHDPYPSGIHPTDNNPPATEQASVHRPSSDLRLRSTMRPSFCYPEDDLAMNNMTLPLFIPSPWQWDDLLKKRKPYRPMLLGLLRRRRDQQHHGPLFGRVTRFFRPLGSKAAQLPPEPPEADKALFVSVSVASLTKHFCRVGRQFYDNVINHVQLRYRQDIHVLRALGNDLVEIHNALQLQASRLAMQRIVTLLHEIASMEATVDSGMDHQSMVCHQPQDSQGQETCIDADEATSY